MKYIRNSSGYNTQKSVYSRNKIGWVIILARVTTAVLAIRGSTTVIITAQKTAMEKSVNVSVTITPLATSTN